MSANKYPVNSSQLNLSPVFKKCQTLQCLLKTLLLPTFNLNEPVQMHCSSPHERRMHLCETWGECLMLKHSLCILNEILLQGSLSSPLACVSMPASILLLLCPDTICTLVFTFGTHTHAPSITRALWPHRSYSKNNQTYPSDNMKQRHEKYILLIIHTVNFLAIRNEI